MIHGKTDISVTNEYNLKSYFRQAGALFMVMALSFALIACMPMKDEEINTELFKDKEDMKTRTANLERGMSKSQVLEELDVPYAKFDAMDTQEIQAAVYGNSQVQGTPEQLEKFSQRLLAYEGLTLPYRHIESAGSIGFGKMKIDKTGHDLKLVLIFEQDKLLKASIVGNEELKLSEDQYIWNTLLKSGVGRVL